jgi:hypothetical protein
MAHLRRHWVSARSPLAKDACPTRWRAPVPPQPSGLDGIPKDRNERRRQNTCADRACERGPDETNARHDNARHDNARKEDSDNPPARPHEEETRSRQSNSSEPLTASAAARSV